MLETDPARQRRYRLTEGTWNALERHRLRHAAKGHGFGRGFAAIGSRTRTLSARYYKDGAEILVRMPDGRLPPRRLTPEECATLMGFTAHFLGRPFERHPLVSDAQAYRQFGNSVVVPQFTWVAEQLQKSVLPQVAAWRLERLRVA
jgi:DNA (cytosine-5)-methyltransferase 1